MTAFFSTVILQQSWWVSVVSMSSTLKIKSITGVLPSKSHSLFIKLASTFLVTHAFQLESHHGGLRCMNLWVLIISNHFMHVVFSLKMMRSLSSVHWLIMGKMLQSFTGAGLYNSLWHLLVTGRLTWHHHFTHPQCVHTSSLWLWADRQRQTKMHSRRGDKKGEQLRKPGRGFVRHRVHSEVQLELVLIYQLQITGLSKCFEKKKKTFIILRQKTWAFFKRCQTDGGAFWFCKCCDLQPWL